MRGFSADRRQALLNGERVGVVEEMAVAVLGEEVLRRDKEQIRRPLRRRPLAGVGNGRLEGRQAAGSIETSERAPVVLLVQLLLGYQVEALLGSQTIVSAPGQDTVEEGRVRFQLLQKLLFHLGQLFSRR